MGMLFGTDGIRGRANRYPVTADMALKTGSAVAFLAGLDYGHGDIVVGKDTRQSGDMIACGLMAGICAMGVDVRYISVMPTPAVAYLTASSDAMAGIMISASHNPYLDNGMPALLTIEDEWNIYPDYHRTTDLPANLTLEMGRQVLRMNVAAMAELVGVESGLLFRDSFESGNLAAWSAVQP